jgi:hypothetical protein
MPHTRHPKIAFALERAVPKLVAQVNVLVANIADHPDEFSDPTPTLKQVTADVKALVDAQTNVDRGLPDATTARDDAKETVENDALALVHYVQTLMDADPARAAAIAEAAGLALQQAAVAHYDDVTVKEGTEPGSVVVTAHNLPKTTKTLTHDWQYSIDTGKTMIDTRSTGLAHTTIRGLPRQAVVQIRHRVVVGDVPGEWSAIVSFLVP